MKSAAANTVQAGAFCLALMIGACAPQTDANSVSSIGASCTEQLSREYRSADVTVKADDRDIPVSVFFPAGAGSYPVITFSHGAFAAPDRYTAMLGPLSASGFIVIAPMHVDSEEMDQAARPSPAVQWATRNADMRIVASVPAELRAVLQREGIAAQRDNVTAMGHSFGALMAQIAGGAQAVDRYGAREDLRDPSVTSVIAWSPPGLIEGRLDGQTWASMAVPSITITGTRDVLPGFIDDWEAHKASYNSAPKGTAALWVGAGVDHYFGGIFGRIQDAPDKTSRVLFERALARTLRFAQTGSGHPGPCALGASIADETFEGSSQ